MTVTRTLGSNIEKSIALYTREIHIFVFKILWHFKEMRNGLQNYETLKKSLNDFLVGHPSVAAIELFGKSRHFKNFMSL